MPDPTIFHPEVICRDLASMVLKDPDLVLRLVEAAPPSELNPPYAQVVAAVAEVYQPGAPLDHWRVFEHLRARLPSFSQEEFYQLWEYGPTPLSFELYLDQLIRGLYRRRVYEFGLRAQALASSDDTEMIAAKLREELLHVSDRLAERTYVVDDGDDLWAWEEAAQVPLIPGVLARQGRVMITGFEGTGKSTVLRQIAIASAYGLHPFKPRAAIAPVGTVYIDLESPDAMVRERLRAMLETLAGRGYIEHGQSSGGRFHFSCRPEGLDVIGRGSDRQFLAQVLAEHKPDLLCIGPVYKLAAGGGDLDEATVGEVIRYLDHLRSVYDVAILVEAHSPHGALDTSNPNLRRVLRPSGSSAWMRYPEVGRGLRHEQKLSDTLGTGVYRLEAWRNDRSPTMRFPEFVRIGGRDEVWFYDCDDDVAAVRERGR